MIKSFYEHIESQDKYEMKWASSVIFGMGFAAITKYGLIEYQKLFKEVGKPDGTEFTDDIDTDPLIDFDEKFDQRMDMYEPSPDGVLTKEEIREISRKSIELAKKVFYEIHNNKSSRIPNTIRAEDQFRKDYQDFKKQYNIV